MIRLQFYPIFDRVNTYTGRAYDEPIWKPSAAERAIVQWLIDNVGPVQASSFRIPLRGTGWWLYEGGREDERPDDYSWRHIQREYKISGEYGFWLQVEDDMKAVELKLSGVLDNIVKPKYWR